MLALLYANDFAGAEAFARETPALTILRLLLSAPSNVSSERCEEDARWVTAYSDDGWTASHLVAFFGNNACAGADIDAVATGGHRPLDSALRNGDHEVIAALQAAGAQVGIAAEDEAP